MGTDHTEDYRNVTTIRITLSLTSAKEKLQKQSDENITDFLPTNYILESNEVEQDIEMSVLALQGAFLRWYHRLKHLSYKKMILLCDLRILPRRLLLVKPLMCTSCKSGSMTRLPWRVKGKKNKRVLKTVTKPGEYVSIDKTESHIPGFIGMMRGFLPKQRYTCATVFVDHYSDFTYNHLQRSTNMNDTLEAKTAFETVFRRHGLTVLHYHANNDRFDDKDCK